MIRFFVPGLPKPQGSKSGFAIKKGGKYTGQVAMKEGGNAQARKAWRHDVAAAAQDHKPDAPWEGPVRIGLTFVMPKPKAPAYPLWNVASWPAKWLADKLPDANKLARSVEDSLTGLIYRDDGQIVDERILKVYPTPRLPEVGCLIVVEYIEAALETQAFGCEPVDSPLPLLCLPEPF